jgi:hypothetical protein
MDVCEKQQHSIEGVKGMVYIFHGGRGVYNLSWELFDVCDDRNGVGGTGERLI